MRDRVRVSMGGFVVVLALAWAASVPIAGQAPNVLEQAAAAKTVSPPRTPWGHPDLQGIWNNSTVTRLERPKELEGKEFLTEKEAADFEERIAQTRLDGPPREGDTGTYNQHWFDRGTKVIRSRRTSLLIDPPDGKIPALTPAAKKRLDAAADARRGLPASYEDIDVGERCITDGLPLFPFVYNNNYQIVQTPDHVVILHEMYQEVRIIPIDGRPHLPEGIGQWFGDSRGRWDGDTLIVDTTNFADKSHYVWGGDGSGVVGGWRASRPTLHLTERFTRVDADTIDYQFTIDDPAMFVRPWTAAIPFAKNQASLGATEGQLYEYACHEGNYSVVNVLKGARAQEKAVEEAAKSKQ